MAAGDLDSNVRVLRGKTMVDEHIHPHRGWALIRDGGAFTQIEFAHLEGCHACHDWLVTFVSLARKAGFHISFEIPPCKPSQRLDAA
jgi:hypothetical protein